MSDESGSEARRRVLRLRAAAACLALSVMSLVYSSGLVPTFQWMRSDPTARIVGFLLHAGLLTVGLGLVVFRRRPTLAAKLALSFAATLTAIASNIALIQIFFEMAPITMGWRSDASEGELNELGFRGRPFQPASGRPVVLLLGDSQVEAMAGSMAQMPEARLEHHLGRLGIDAAVRSLGAAGYGQDQQLLALREYFERHSAEVVALWFTPGNDIWNNVFPTHLPVNGAPKPTFRLVDGRLTPPLLDWDAKSFTSPIKAVALWQKSRSRPLFVGRDDLWESFLPPPAQSLKNYDGPADTTWEDVPDPLALIVEHLESEKSHFSIWLTPPSPRMDYGVRLTRALLSEIRSLAKSNGARLVVFHARQPPRTDGVERVFSLTGKHYRASESQMEKTVDRIAEGHEWIRLPVRLKDWRVSKIDSHLNAAANDDTMQRLAVELRSRMNSREED